MEQHYFFHSFPRPRHGESATLHFEKGVRIARSMLANGLLLTPENYSLPIFDDNGREIDSLSAVQRRACFTELRASLLPEHAKSFGPFSLVYELPALRRLGAIPVFYIPREIEAGYLSSLATQLLIGITDASRIVASLAMIQHKLTISPDVQLKNRGRTVEYSPAECDIIRSFIETLTNFSDADAGMTDARLRAVASCFYPTENREYTEELAYYHQREWRIVHGSFSYAGIDPFSRCTTSQLNTLLEIDHSFFSKELNFQDRASGRLLGATERDTLGSRSYFYRQLGELDVVGSASFFVRPNEVEVSEELRDSFSARGVETVSQDYFRNGQ